jgi:hypothetical protein
MLIDIVASSACSKYADKKQRQDYRLVAGYCSRVRDGRRRSRLATMSAEECKINHRTTESRVTMVPTL